jgi:hypothetical protein
MALLVAQACVSVSVVRLLHLKLLFHTPVVIDCRRSKLCASQLLIQLLFVPFAASTRARVGPDQGRGCLAVLNACDPAAASCETLALGNERERLECSCWMHATCSMCVCVLHFCVSPPYPIMHDAAAHHAAFVPKLSNTDWHSVCWHSMRYKLTRGPAAELVDCTSGYQSALLGLCHNSTVLPACICT